MRTEGEKIAREALDLAAAMPGQADWAETVVRWEDLWRQATDAGQWGALTNAQAAIVCSTGWQLCMYRGEHARGLEYADAYLSREDIPSADAVDFSYLNSMAGLSSLLLDRYETSVSAFRKSLEIGHQARTGWQRIIVRSYLCGYLQQLEPSDIVPRVLSDLAMEVAEPNETEEGFRNVPMTVSELSSQLNCR